IVGKSENVFTNHINAPLMDHTTQSQNGHYAYFIGASASYIAEGALRVANPYRNQTVCFTFYYYFKSFGSSSFQLSMDMLTGTLGLLNVPAYTETLFHSYGVNELNWKRVSLTIIPKRDF